MASVEERMKILKMIEEGKISAEDGAKLLGALNDSRKAAQARPTFTTTGPGGNTRYLRVRVSDSSSGRPKVNVNIPMSLVNVGLKMGARFAPELEGVNLDELRDAINSGMTGKIIDVSDEEDGEHVEIFVE